MSNGMNAESQIKEGNILEFKAPTTTKRIFDQMQEVKSSPGMPFIGWVNLGDEWFIAQSGNTLVKVRRMDMVEYYAGSGDREEIMAEANRAGVGPSRVVNWRLDALRDSLPQIFLK